MKTKHVSGLIQTIYAVQQLENGLTQFLVYYEGMCKWLWWLASEYKPTNPTEYYVSSFLGSYGARKTPLT